MNHLLSIEDLSFQQISDLLNQAFRFQKRLAIAQPESRLPNNPILATLFFEPSTRTRLSFEAAMIRLGGSVISAHDHLSSSCAKGESLEDTIRVVSESYADILVVRHPDKGAVRTAAEFAAAPIINGGDGDGEHPTQALCDLYALWQCLGELDGARVVIFGDTEYSRAAHSFKQGLNTMGAEPLEINYKRQPSDWARWEDISAIYVTRPQLERLENARTFISLDSYNRLARRVINMFPEAFIMHPLPRTGEIGKDLDQDPRSIYFAQAQAGVPVRMAVLHDSLSTV